MDANLPDTRNTILAMMDVTRRQWRISWREARDHLPGELAEYAWPTSDRHAGDNEGETLVRVLRNGIDAGAAGRNQRPPG